MADCIENPDFTAKKTGKEWRLQAAGLPLTLTQGGTRTGKGGFVNLFSLEEGDLSGKTRSPLGRGNKGEFQLCEGIAAQLHDGPNLVFRPRDGVELGELERAESKGN